MNTRTRMSVCAMVLFLVIWGITPAILEAQSPGDAESADERSPGPPADDGDDVSDADAQSIGPRHEFPQETLGSGSHAIDAWAIECPSHTHHLHFDVFDFSSSGPTLAILCYNFETGAPAVYRRANQGQISPSGQVNGGGGFYVCYIQKRTPGGSTGYDSRQVCHTSGHGFINHFQHFLFIDQ